MKGGIGIVEESDNPIKQDPNFNLAMSRDVQAALSEKCERANQLEKYAEEVKSQAKIEIDELKDMVQKIGKENLRLKELLRENGVDYDGR